jgi:hypothetical protein
MTYKFPYKESPYIVVPAVRLAEATGRLPFLDGTSRELPRSPKKSRNLITFGNDCKVYLAPLKQKFQVW